MKKEVIKGLGKLAGEFMQGGIGKKSDKSRTTGTGLGKAADSIIDQVVGAIGGSSGGKGRSGGGKGGGGRSGGGGGRSGGGGGGGRGGGSSSGGGRGGGSGSGGGR